MPVRNLALILRSACPTLARTPPGAERRFSPAGAAVLPVILELAAQAMAAKSDDGVGGSYSPEHSGALQASTNEGLASGLDDPGTDAQMLSAKGQVTHACSARSKIVDLMAHEFGRLGRGGGEET